MTFSIAQFVFRFPDVGLDHGVRDSIETIRRDNRLEWWFHNTSIIFFLCFFVEGEVYPRPEGNDFSLFTGHMSFQIFLLVRHFTNWTGRNLLTDNTLKKITQDVLVRCSAIVSDLNAKLAGQFQNLVGQCPVAYSYFRHGGHIILYWAVFHL